MKAEDNANKNDFNYVWQCTATEVEEKQTIPMREGDYLFVCVDPDGSAHFRYRKKDWRENTELCAETKENTGLWGQATGRFDPQDGVLRGQLNETRKFEMKIARKGNGFTVTCRHFFNPDEGSWSGDDGWGGLV